MIHALTALLQEAGLSPHGALQPLSGGDSAATYRLQTREGNVVVKNETITPLG